MAKMNKIAVIFGTRPEAIKLAPVILALRGEHSIQCHVCVTAQHRQMLDQVLGFFAIEPDEDLDLMRPNQTLGGLTARAIEALDKYFSTEKPDLVLVQGDTTTVFCATLAAFYHKIPVGHVEAGLRTGNLQSPWPEEANRVLTTRLATLHFAPTETNRQNLLKEGVPDDRISVTGNTVIDALFIALEKVHQNPPHIPGLPDFLQPTASNPQPSTLNPQLVLITGHRRENFGKGFDEICRALADLAKRFPRVQFIYPVHLNPNVRAPVQRILGEANSALSTLRSRATAEDGRTPHSALGNVHLIEPLSYPEFVSLMDQATLILTDSGGVQEEAPSLGKPVLVMRETTERPEGVQAGTVKLVGADSARIVAETSRLLEDPGAYAAMARAANPYGDGHASERIVKAIVRAVDDAGK
jgi:UDP-N-acetylglucosamine 2-epimerase (non-hydrolysing)